MNVDQLNVATYNPRKDLQLGDIEYEKLAQSIDEFGYVQLIVWNEATGNVVGGHQGLKILVERGETEVNVCVVNLSCEREKALNVALNKVRGRWDNAKLVELLEELTELDFDVGLTGFDQGEIDLLLVDTSEICIDSIFEEAEQGEKKTKTCPHCGGEI